MSSIVPGPRQIFKHEGREIYSWDQTLDDVNVYIKPPPGVKASHLDITIGATHLKIGLKGNPPFIDQDLSSSIIIKDSLWLMEDGEIHFTLTKAKKAETWPSVFKGHGELDETSKVEVQKRLLLERFQEEHPGFDFSGAEINGMVPDAREFMGGMKRA
jgi:CS domain